MSGPQRDGEDGAVFDAELLAALAESMTPVRTDSERAARLRARVFQRLDEDRASPEYHTLRAGEGEWQELLPRVRKKTLHVDTERGVESYLLRLLPGGSLPRHVHHSGELCYVVSGEVRFGDFALGAGDCHYAPAGSEHLGARSEQGALLFLQSAISSSHHCP